MEGWIDEVEEGVVYGRYADGVTGFAMELLDVPEEQRVDLQPGMYCTFVNGALLLHKPIWTTHSRDLARAKAARLYQVMGWDHK